MNKKLWTMAALASTLALAACQPVDKEEVTEDPTAGGDVPTETPTETPTTGGDEPDVGDQPDAAGTGVNNSPVLLGLDATPANPGSWTLSGVPSVIKATITPKNKGKVPDGTMVMFRASAGYIIGDDPAIDTISGGDPKDHFAVCFTVNNVCSVTWYSGPEENMKSTFEGDVSILAFTAGSNPFENTIKNDVGNPKYDLGERFTSWGEPFNDLNMDGVVTSYEYRYKPTHYTNDKPIYATEYYYDVNQDASPTDTFSVYYGHHCADENQSSGCGQDAWLSTNVKLIESSTVLLLTQLSPGLTSQNLAAGSEVEYSYSLGDVKGLGLDGVAIESHIPPAGTEVKVSCDGSVTAEINEAIVPNAYQKSPHFFEITFSAADDAEVGKTVKCNISLESGDSTYKDDVTFSIVAGA